MTAGAPAASAWIATPAGPLHGTVAVPGDKSVSHRAIMLGAIAEGVTRIEGFLEGEDTRATAAIFRRLGVQIDAPSDGVRIVHGVGLHGLQPSSEPLDCGNAGTAMRLLAGLLAGQRFDSVLVGDASLSKRPMRRVIEPLAAMGALIESDGGCAPLRIRGGRALQGIDASLPVASAQVKSALLLAGLYANGETHVREPHPTRDYSERMLAAFGVPCAFVPGEAALLGGFPLQARDVSVPADISSAAFFIVAATLEIAAAILTESTLSFLGLGFPSDVPTWGRLLYEGKDFLTTMPWISFFPGLLISLTILAINFMGDGLRDALDPRQRQ